MTELNEQDDAEVLAIKDEIGKAMERIHALTEKYEGLGDATNRANRRLAELNRCYLHLSEADCDLAEWT